jgi:hypothetical protein
MKYRTRIYFYTGGLEIVLALYHLFQGPKA